MRMVDCKKCGIKTPHILREKEWRIDKDHIVPKYHECYVCGEKEPIYEVVPG